MIIKEIKLDSFRAYEFQEIAINEGINLFYGDNGSGTHARFQKNGTDIYNNGTNTPAYDEKAGNHQSLTMFCLVELSTDDYVECVRNNTTRGMQSAIAGFLVR